MNNQNLKEVRYWKKVLENDLDNIVLEIRELIERPAVIVLSGEVGVGKTTFTRKFIGPLKDIRITSPTYSIINEVGPHLHADFYRLKSSEEITNLELNLYLEGKEYFLVEWGRPYIKQIRDQLDENYHFYELEIAINSKENRPIQEITRNYFLNQISL